MKKNSLTSKKKKNLKSYTSGKVHENGSGTTNSDTSSSHSKGVVNNYITNNYYSTSDKHKKAGPKVVRATICHMYTPDINGAVPPSQQFIRTEAIPGFDRVDYFVIKVVEELDAQNQFVFMYYFGAVKQILSEDDIKDYTSDEFANVLSYATLIQKKAPCSSTFRKIDFGKNGFPNWKTDKPEKHVKRMVKIAEEVRKRYYLLKA